MAAGLGPGEGWQLWLLTLARPHKGSASRSAERLSAQKRAEAPAYTSGRGFRALLRQSWARS